VAADFLAVVFPIAGSNEDGGVEGPPCGEVFLFFDGRLVSGDPGVADGGGVGGLGFGNAAATNVQRQRFGGGEREASAVDRLVGVEGLGGGEEGFVADGGDDLVFEDAADLDAGQVGDEDLGGGIARGGGHPSGIHGVDFLGADFLCGSVGEFFLVPE